MYYTLHYDITQTPKFCLPPFHTLGEIFPCLPVLDLDVSQSFIQNRPTMVTHISAANTVDEITPLLFFRMSNNRKNDSNMAKFAAVSAAGALLGLAAYGIKKVYDQYEESNRNRAEAQHAEKVRSVETYDDADYPSTSRGRNQAASSSTGAAAASGRSSAAMSSAIRDEPLHVQLDHYYKTYCQVPRWEMSRAKEVVDDVKKVLLRFVQRHLPEMKVVALRDAGSVEEGLKVIHADNFDVMIHLELDPQSWILKECEHSPGYFSITLKDDAMVSHDLQNQSDGNSLSPSLVVSRFQSIIHRLTGQPDAKYQIQNCSNGGRITLSVSYSIQGREKSVKIHLVPAVVLNSTWVVAKQHPRASVIPGHENLWRESFAMDEHSHLNANPNLPLVSCHRKTLMIIKAIRLNHLSQLGPLSSYALKTVLMHMLDQEDEWSDMVLSERIFDFLLALKQYLTNRELPCYFCPEMNLLEGVRPETCDSIRHFIIQSLDSGIIDLLKTDY